MSKTWRPSDQDPGIPAPLARTTLERHVQCGPDMTAGVSLLALASLFGQAALETAPPPSAPAAEIEVATSDGLYPVWEQTGITAASGSGEIGYLHAQGALGRLQLGTQPLLDLFGVLNVNGKLALWRGEATWAALRIAGYRLPAGAQDRTIGQLHASRFENPYAPVTAVPVTLALSWQPTARARLHAASTVLVSRSDESFHRTVSAGESLLVELFASPHWAARLHTGVEGLGAEAQAHAGLSVAYGLRWLRLEAGYARTFVLAGEPGDGRLMFDGALLFR